ncbi:hypothetical protein E3N88_23028 [Mikania micrantha]|uniref:Uncharacterized protein n=1 Tax=Mikania micrantha TaxID=192012 RepID=A0A5N6NDU6_9ASTR|nr:hypothetical protein E3N88_23028 [Mikania micrantha]
MGSDLGKIQIVGHYLAVIWKPARMNLEGGVVKLQLKIIMMSSQQPKLLTHAWNVQIYSFLRGQNEYSTSFVSSSHDDDNDITYKSRRSSPRRTGRGKRSIHADQRGNSHDKLQLDAQEHFLTKKDIVAQIVFASVVGDMVLALAYALEVPHYGSKVGPQTMLKGALDSRINIPNGEKMISK